MNWMIPKRFGVLEFLCASYGLMQRLESFSLYDITSFWKDDSRFLFKKTIYPLLFLTCWSFSMDSTSRPYKPHFSSKYHDQKIRF
jgi:hypothetical protein